MKYLSLIAVAALMASCAGNTENESKETADMPVSEEIKITKNMDPVCKMERDTSWTDYAVKGTDTTWFCSIHCKDVYSANPEKHATTPQPE